MLENNVLLASFSLTGMLLFLTKYNKVVASDLCTVTRAFGCESEHATKIWHVWFNYGRGHVFLLSISRLMLKCRHIWL